MRNINIIGALLILSFTTCYADQLKPNSKWIPRAGYVFNPSHMVPLDTAKKWVDKNIAYLCDFEYSISEVNNNYEVFIDYIRGYSEKGEPLFTVGL